MNQNFPFERPANPEIALELFTLPIEEINLVLVDGPTVDAAEPFIAACERCDQDAEISFDYLLDELTGSDPSRTEYLMYRVARCPRCQAEVTEKTLIIPE